MKTFLSQRTPRLRIFRRARDFLAALLVLESGPLQAHEHLAAGAVTPEQDATLLFVNAANFAAESGYVVRLDAATNGPYAGFHYTEDLTFVCLAATPDLGGPAPFHPALGAHVEAAVESVDGPSGGSFGFWESTEDTGLPIQLTFSVPVGEGEGTRKFPVSENHGSPAADPYGHIHGRVFSATSPGLYRVGFRFVDTSNNGQNAGPLHTPSLRFHINFQAGITVDGVVVTPDGVQITFAASGGFVYVVEAATAFADTTLWLPVAGPITGNDRLQTITVPLTDERTRFFRLHRDLL